MGGARGGHEARWRHTYVNMASQDEELDFRSDRFNPARVLSTPDVQLPNPEAEEFNDLYNFRDTVHSHRFNVERDLPGVSVVCLGGREAKAACHVWPGLLPMHT